MKNLSLQARLFLAAQAVLLLAPSARATLLYWDLNGTTANAGTTGAGAWDGTNAFWNSDATGGAGGAVQAVTASTDDLSFSSGTGYSAGGTVTVTGAVVANSVTFVNGGAITLTGGTSLTLSGATGLNFTNGTAANFVGTPIILGASTAFTNSDNSLQTITGGVTGAFNLTLNGNSTGAMTFTTGSINIAGTITNSGTGTNTSTLAGVGPNVTALTQSSTTSALTVAGALSLNSGGTTLTNTLGTKALTVSGGTTGTGNLVLNNNSTLASGIVLSTNSVNHTGTITNSGTGTGTLVINAPIGSSVSAILHSANGSITLSGATVANTGNITFAGTGASTATFSAASITTAGSITNSGTTTGATTISGALGSTVTGVTQNSGTSALTLSGANATFAGPVSLTAGTLNINHNNALGTGAFTIAAGTVIDNTTATAVVNAGNNAMNWNGNFTYTGTRELDLGTGNVTLAGPLTLTSGGAATRTLTIGGVVSGGNGVFDITKAGAGTLAFTHDISLSGPQTATVSAGTLVLSGLVVGGNGIFDVAKAGAGTLTYTRDVALSGINNVAGIAAGTEIFSGTLSGSGAGLNAASVGTLVLSGANTYTGATTVRSGTLKLSGLTGGAASSDFTTTGAALLNFDSTTAGVSGTTRAASLTLKGTTLTVTGNTNGAGNVNSTDTIAGSLTADASSAPAGGANIVTVSGGTATNWQLAAGSLVRANHSAILFRGTGLGANTVASHTINTANISFTTAPTLVGGGGAAGTTNLSIIPWAVGDSTAAGTGTSFVTHDANGIRPLNTATEYDATLTGGTANDHNVMLPASSTLTIDGDTTINSLFVLPTTTLGGTGKLTITSGAVFAAYGTTSPTITKQLDFGAVEGVIGSTTSANQGLNISGGISGSGGVTFYNSAGITSGDTGIRLGAATTYTGNTYVIGGITLNALDVLPNGSRAGDVYVYGRLSVNTALNSVTTINGLFGSGVVAGDHSQSKQLSVGDNDTSSTFSGIFIDFGQLTLNKIGTGTLTLTSTGSTRGGPTNVMNGILSVVSLNSVAGGSASSTLGHPTSIASGTIGLGATTNTGQLTYTGPGETTDRVIKLAGTTGGGVLDQSGTGLLKFTSAFTATGAGAKTLTLQGSTIGGGEIAGAIVDNNGINTTSLLKQGSGVWTLSGGNTYTGLTTINAGTLVVNGSLSGTTVVNAGTLSGTGIVGTVTIGDSLGTPGSAVLSPGRDGIIGTLVTTAVDLTASDSAFRFDVNSNAVTSDSLNIFADLTLGSGQSAFVGFDVQPTPLASGTLFTLATTNNGVTGFFSGYSEGATYTLGGNSYRISYGQDVPNALTLTVIPEPAAGAFLLGGLAISTLARRRRTRAT